MQTRTGVAKKTQIETDFLAEKPVSLDIGAIQKMLLDGFENTRNAKDQNLVLLLGNSGVGKSTTANYLLDPKNMLRREIKKEGKKGSHWVVDTIKPSLLPMGHEGKAETLYATPIPHPNFAWCLTDCPGFLGDRKIEQRVVESISTELAIRNACQVQGIVVLISMHSISNARLKELMGLVKTLFALFRDPAAIIGNTIFGITQCYVGAEIETAHREVLYKIEQLVDICTEKLEILKEGVMDTEGLTASDYGSIGDYFSKVLQADEKILLINPIDGGVSRQKLIDQLNSIRPSRPLSMQVKKSEKSGESLGGYYVGKAKDLAHQVGRSVEKAVIHPITIKDFNFSNYDEYRGKFNQAIYDLADEGSQHLDNIFAYSASLKKMIREHDDSKERIETLHGLLVSLSDSSQDSTGREHSIEVLRKTIERNDKKIQENQREGQLLMQKINDLSEELGKINTNALIAFRELHESKNTGLIFSKWRKYPFEADTEDKTVPLVIEKECKNGKFAHEEDRSGQGFYKVVYESNMWANPAKADIVAKIKTKDESGNKLRIIFLQKTIPDLENKARTLLEETEELVRANQILQSNITRTERSGLLKVAEREQMIAQTKTSIEDYQKKIADYEIHIPILKNKGSEFVKILNKKRDLYKIVCELSTMLDFPSPLVSMFVQKFITFDKELDNIVGFFDGRNSTTVLNIPQEDIGDLQARDPITNGEIRDPVIVSYQGNSYIFDHHTLLKKFGENPKKGVTTYNHKFSDDREITIKYLQWTKYSTPQLSVKKLEISESDTIANRSRIRSLPTPSSPREIPGSLNEAVTNVLPEPQNKSRIRSPRSLPTPTLFNEPIGLLKAPATNSRPLPPAQKSEAQSGRNNVSPPSALLAGPRPYLKSTSFVVEDEKMNSNRPIGGTRTPFGLTSNAVEPANRATYTKPVFSAVKKPLANPNQKPSDNRNAPLEQSDELTRILERQRKKTDAVNVPSSESLTKK